MTRFQKYVVVALAVLLALPLFAGPRRRAVAGTPAGPDVKISGVVRDSVTNAPIRAVSVISGDLMSDTSSTGRYSITVPSGSISLTFQRSGYDPKTVTLAATTDQTVDVTLTPRPTTKVTMVNGTVYELDTESFIFAYNIPFVGPARSEFPNLCAADGTTWRPARETIAKVIGPGTLATSAACCPNGQLVSATFLLKNGQQAVGYFADSCVGYTIDIGGVDHATGSFRYLRINDVKEVVFP